MPINFTPSASVSIQPDAIPGTFAMPPADPGNTDTSVQLTGTATQAWITFSGGAQAGPGVPGCVSLRAGIPLLLTPNANTLAAAAGKDTVRPDQGASTASACTVAGMMRGGTVAITRGTAVVQQTF